MAGRGGARPGAGRPPGAANKVTREIADKAAAEGTTPLEIMLKELREMYALVETKRGQILSGDDKLDPDQLAAFNGLVREVRKMAIACAPYMHPRLITNMIQGGDQPVEINVKTGVPRSPADPFVQALPGEIVGAVAGEPDYLQ